MRCFLSHNMANKQVARSVGAHLTLSGIDVWFDEWEILAGDSIPIQRGFFSKLLDVVVPCAERTQRTRLGHEQTRVGLHHLCGPARC